ncbi:MAG: hypothetical protein ACKOX6_11230 [Bdellovibrio sp.]
MSDNKQHPLIKPIAEALGFELGPTQYEHGGDILTDFGAKFFIRFDTWRKAGKAEVSGQYPTDCTGQTHYPRGARTEIGFSQTKSVDKIANDIAKRFLPEFKEQWQICKEAAEKSSRYYEDKSKRLNDVVKVAGLNYDAITPQRAQNEVTGFLNDSDNWCRVRACSDTLDLEIHSLPDDLAFKIIEMVRAHERISP